MNILFLTATALTLSIDSFICGFSLAGNGDKKAKILLLTTCIVFCVGAAAYLLGDIVSDIMHGRLSDAGGFALIAIGGYNLVKTYSHSDKTYSENENAAEYALTGFALGADNAFAILSLSAAQYPALAVPLVFTAAHAVLMWAGLICRGKTVSKAGPDKFKFLPPIILIVLGLTRLEVFFI